MFFRDHLPPNFHAVYNEYNGIFHLETLELIEGDLPPRAIKLIKEWSADYKEVLDEMWQTKEFRKLPGLK